MATVHKASRSPKRKKVRKTSTSSPLVRLNKYLAQSGVCSRRQADEFIEEGVVKVNGKAVYELGRKVDPRIDKVVFKGKPVRPVSRYTYLVAFKPRNMITTMDDPVGRPTIKDLVPKKYKKLNLFPVGRLDWNSEGLLILTNDGDYAQKILHPNKNVPKTYEVKVEGSFLGKDVQKLLKGVTIPGGKAKAVHAEVFKKSLQGSHSWVKISVIEGRNHLIRKMMQKLGYSIMRLRRVQIGNLKVSHLKAGDVAELSELRKDLVFQVPPKLRQSLNA